MNFPDDLYYSKEHTWVRIEKDQAVIGISDYAQDNLGDIVFLELPEDNTEVEQDQSFGVIESTKSVSELYSPISGKVIEINEPLIDGPELINEDPYIEGWMIRVEISNKDEIDSLLHADEYEDYVNELESEVEEIDEGDDLEEDF